MESVSQKQDKQRKGKKHNWKDKRDKKRFKKEQFKLQQWANPDEKIKEPEPEYHLHQFKMGSPKFDEYYKEKLPVTFRINQTEVQHEKVIEMLKDPHFVEKYYQDGVQAQDQEDLRNMELDLQQVKIDCKKYYPPGNVLFQMTVPRDLLKKNQGLKAIHKLVQKSNDSGILTRQEIVSMLPPLLLDIQAEHSVFDMCAAPGSKTAQVFELMMSSHMYEREKLNTAQTQGFIVANDADSKRAFMLTHQMNRLNTSNIIILNHNAQNFPSLCYKDYVHTSGNYDSRVLFDRIVCDVPCSSDAAIRKIPQKWDKWCTNDGASLHLIQQRILFRGLQLLKVGGKISYSTCSLNPIEDEAVVASALKQFAGCIQLETVEVPGFLFRKGITQWKVMAEKKDRQEGESYFVEFDKFEDVVAPYSGNNIKDTMFMNHYDQGILNELPKCLRVFPHDQDTSGFFITIIKKIKDFDSNGEDAQQEEQKANNVKAVELKPSTALPLVIQKRDRIHTFEFTRCDPQDPDVQYLQAYYGLTADFPVDQLVTQSDEMKKLFFISPQLSKFLYADCHTQHLNIVNMGVQLFMRNSSKFSTNSECIFRISQDGILNVVPYMTKRLVWVDTMDQFKYFLTHKNIDVEDLPGERVKQEIGDLSTGCFVLAINLKGDNVEALTMHKFQRSVNMMVSREHVFSLHIRYLEKEEREKVATLFELDK